MLIILIMPPVAAPAPALFLKQLEANVAVSDLVRKIRLAVGVGCGVRGHYHAVLDIRIVKRVDVNGKPAGVERKGLRIGDKPIIKA